MDRAKFKIFIKWYRNKLKGYVKVKGKPILVHPKTNNVYEITDGPTVVGVKLQKGEYPTFTIKGINYGLHRVKCETFKKIPNEINPSKAIPNHLDGDKWNCDVDNLEWTDYTGNIIHAFKSGLRTDNVMGVAEDIIDGGVYEFYSYSDFSRQINIHSGYLSLYMKKPKNYPFLRRYVITLKGQERPNITKDDIWKAGIGTEMPIKVKDTQTGDVKLFTSFTGMKKSLGVNYAQKERFIAGKTFVFGKGRHLVTVLTDYDEIMKAFETDPNFLNRNMDHVKYVTVKPKKVEVTFPNKTIAVYNSLRECADKLGVTFPALQKRLSSYNGNWKDHKIKYLSTNLTSPARK